MSTRKLLTLKDLARLDEKIKKAEKGMKESDSETDKILEAAEKAAKMVSSIKD